ncbi:MAG: NAD-dependent epimerase/dehydratase family protein [Rhodococcus sp. (in: high G+C Gram-positive bacteria)]
MRIAITGATGNVGTVLLERLSREDVDVVGISRRRPPETPPYAGSRWQEMDIADSDAEERLVDVFAGVDAVVHAAIGFQPMRDRGYLRRTNVGGTAAVAGAAARAGVRRLVHMSSSGVYSPGSYGRPVDENYSRTGITESTYSVDKAAAEFALDEVEAQGDGPSIVRLRPGMVGQYNFGSALLRYALPDLVPSWVVDRVPLLPMDRSIMLPAVASADVAEAIVAALTTTHAGAFNLSAPTPIRYTDFESALDARAIPVPRAAMRAAAAFSFATRLQSVHPGWVDLAYETPLLDTTRARTELGWTATLDGPAVLADVVKGMRERASGTSAPLRKRTAADRLGSLLHGTVSRRSQP